MFNFIFALLFALPLSPFAGAPRPEATDERGCPREWSSMEFKGAGEEVLSFRMHCVRGVNSLYQVHIEPVDLDDEPYPESGYLKNERSFRAYVRGYHFSISGVITFLLNKNQYVDPGVPYILRIETSATTIADLRTMISVTLERGDHRRLRMLNTELWQSPAPLVRTR